MNGTVKRAYEWGEQKARIAELENVLIELEIKYKHSDKTVSELTRDRNRWESCAVKLERAMEQLEKNNDLLRARVKELTREVENFKGYLLGGNK